jgi:hypothetical protein
MSELTAERIRAHAERLRLANLGDSLDTLCAAVGAYGVFDSPIAGAFRLSLRRSRHPDEWLGSPEA